MLQELWPISVRLVYEWPAASACMRESCVVYTLFYRVPVLPCANRMGPSLLPVFHDQLDGAEERVCLPKDLCESPLPASAERERERAASHTSKFQQATYAGSLTIDVIALGIKTQLKLNSTQLMSQVERGTLHWERYASRCLRSSLPVITPRTRTSD